MFGAHPNLEPRPHMRVRLRDLTLPGCAVNVSALRPVPKPQDSKELRHVVLRSGNEDMVGAVIVARFATEREAVAEGERLLAKEPDFHFWHLVVEHEMQRATIITSRSLDERPPTKRG